ncbi:putative ABC-transporter ATP-binding protein [Azorhizobium caulinodans ORS 571]|uniref:Putative ABC-transporter ATP-binding protein n=1 Tax=Azorhizobium caulinodans (strain ATCC 43989 / DSM 5975 / JCM 20966 / LMG 6465 / NBRC 14845 / NCIMB 13405 / ORS 571) TaxID=438753 RepID=A8ICF0_AZOC5|nr:ABC transporter ATP-binding protein [Azorhizobium caulinodans]BAF89198.1 putative ABC-transporter ATP-binding protein [Azorhizobium caulinodans ORS 571]
MLEMRGIEKRYGAVLANRGIDLAVGEGRILGLLGENGSGKSTLMKVLFGIVSADAGTITFKGRELKHHGPREAIAASLGMIHQHFTLVDAMSVTENIMLAWDRAGWWLKPKDIAGEIRRASAAFGLDIDPDARVGDMPHGQRQRVEIMKAILGGAELLILDEPTSNLSPPEVAGLMEVMRKLKAKGHAIIFISHKLDEVLEICDEVVVLRDGAVTGRSPTIGATKASLAHMMVGRDVTAHVERADIAPGPTVLRVSALSRRDEAGIARLSDVSFSLRSGEVLAVAGVDGNGQTDLAEVLAGLKAPTGGGIDLDGEDITFAPVKARLAAGLAYIPVDRATTSLVPAMTVADNLALREFDAPPFSRAGFLDTRGFRARALERMRGFDIRAAGPQSPARTLSGGNQQKIVLAREIGRAPKVLIAFQPTWGLDPGATRFVIDQILALRAAGGAILYLSAALDEVLMLGDRIAVMHGGHLSEPKPRAEVDVTEIGLLMAGIDPATGSRAA